MAAATRPQREVLHRSSPTRLTPAKFAWQAGFATAARASSQVSLATLVAVANKNGELFMRTDAPGTKPLQGTEALQFWATIGGMAVLLGTSSVTTGLAEGLKQGWKRNVNCSNAANIIAAKRRHQENDYRALDVRTRAATALKILTFSERIVDVTDKLGTASLAVFGNVAAAAIGSNSTGQLLAGAGGAVVLSLLAGLLLLHKTDATTGQEQDQTISPRVAESSLVPLLTADEQRQAKIADWMNTQDMTTAAFLRASALPTTAAESKERTLLGANGAPIAMLLFGLAGAFFDVYKNGLSSQKAGRKFALAAAGLGSSGNGIVSLTSGLNEAIDLRQSYKRAFSRPENEQQ